MKLAFLILALFVCRVSAETVTKEFYKSWSLAHTNRILCTGKHCIFAPPKITCITKDSILWLCNGYSYQEEYHLLTADVTCTTNTTIRDLGCDVYITMHGPFDDFSWFEYIIYQIFYMFFMFFILIFTMHR